MFELNIWQKRLKVTGNGKPGHQRAVTNDKKQQTRKQPHIAENGGKNQYTGITQYRHIAHTTGVPGQHRQHGGQRPEKNIGGNTRLLLMSKPASQHQNGTASQHR